MLEHFGRWRRPRLGFDQRAVARQYHAVHPSILVRTASPCTKSLICAGLAIDAVTPLSANHRATASWYTRRDSFEHGVEAGQRNAVIVQPLGEQSESVDVVGNAVLIRRLSVTGRAGC